MPDEATFAILLLDILVLVLTASAGQLSSMLENGIGDVVLVVAIKKGGSAVDGFSRVSMMSENRQPWLLSSPRCESRENIDRIRWLCSPMVAGLAFIGGDASSISFIRRVYLRPRSCVYHALHWRPPDHWHWSKAWVLFLGLLIIIDHVTVFLFDIALALFERRLGLLLFPIAIENLPQIDRRDSIFRHSGAAQQCY
jgi:hypothetical protein